MSIKQKLKYMLGTVGLVGAVFAFVLVPSGVANAASCGGVQTAIISCGQTGSCANNNPTEGTDPKGNPDAIKAYVQQYGHQYGQSQNPTEGSESMPSNKYQELYGHAYGKCKDGSDPIVDTTQNGVWGLLLVAINILTAGVGIAAVGGIVYGSILYTSSGGNAEQTKKAIDFIRNVIIGVVAYALMFAFLNFIVPGGLFAQ
ncbi:hypothetical protein EPN95_02215 [Patescibacteria group bacterium]|nr:MAG: hypothetical protein EPN95_02215 [Patescibacteria group bacterium]